MTCFTVNQRQLCQKGLTIGFAQRVDLFQLLIKLSDHPTLAAFPDAPIVSNLRNPAVMFSENASPTEMVFDLIQQIEASSLCRELVEVAHEYNPFNPRIKLLYQEMQPLPVASAEVRDALEKAILIKPDQFINPADWFKRLAPIEFRVCRIEFRTPIGKSPIGTGFLVGPDLILTNYHVVENAHKRLEGESPHQIVAAFDRKLDAEDKEFLSGPEFTLNNPDKDDDWLVAFSPPDPDDGQDDPISKPERPNALDYALLRLNGKPGDEPIIGQVNQGSPQKRGYFALNQEEVSQPQAQGSLIIFQHPQSQIKLNNPNYAPLVLDLGTISGMNQTRLTYTTSTLSGSSGSPCFDREFRLVALHNALIKTKALNQGIPLQAIVQDLVQNGHGALLNLN